MLHLQLQLEENNMDQDTILKYKKIIIITLIIFVVILLIATLLFSMNRNGGSTNSIIPIGQAPTPEVTGDFTGFVEPEFTTEEQAEIDQNTELYKLSPFNGNGFTITYNYETFQYDVIILDPITESRNNFNSFINAQFSAIPQEKFNIMEMSTL